MIQLKKPLPPKNLITKGAEQTEAHWEEWRRNSQRIRAGKGKIQIKDSLYKSKAIKEKLKTAQKGKCAFCESFFAHISYGDIEHFRPKGGWRQNANDKLSRPGYFWLAYNWDNLFYSCQLCNQRFKKNRFPLENPTQRATPERPDLAIEKPLLVRPDEPAQEHIEFIAQVPKGLTRRGRKTIQVLGLDRDELNVHRLKRLREVAASYHYFNYFDGIKKEDRTAEEERLRSALQAKLKNASRPKKEYSSCVASAKKSNFEHVPWPSGDFV